MDFSGSETYDDRSDEGEAPQRGCLGQMLRFVCVVLALAALVATVCAYLLTTDLGRLWLLGRINRAIAPARLSVASWEVPLFGSARLSGVEYSSPVDGMRLEIRQVVLARGVFALVPAGRLALGEITWESPVFTFDPASAADEEPSRKVADAELTGKKSGFFLPVLDVSGKLRVNNGSLVFCERGKPLFESGGIGGQLVVDSLWRPFGFEVKGAAGGGDVALTVALRSIMALANGDAGGDEGDKAVLQLSGVDIAAFKPLFAAAGAPVLPHGGVAEGALTLERAGVAGAFSVEGGMLVDNLRLADSDGGVSPAGNVALLVDARIADALCTISKFDFSSPWGRAKIGGRLRQVDDNRRVAGDIEAEITLHVAALTRDFGRLLGISNDLKFSGGAISAHLKMQESGESIDVQASLKADNIAMLYKGRPATLDRAPSLVLKARLSENLFPDVEELRFRSSFADIYGQGNVRQAVLKGYVDLTQFSSDFRGLLPEKTELGGAAHFNLLTKPSGNDTDVDFMTKLSRLKLSVPRAGVTSVQEGSVAFKGKVAGADKAGKIADLAFHDVTYDLRLEKSRVNGEIKRFVPLQEGEKLPVMRGFTLSADVALNDAVRGGGVFMTDAAYAAVAAWKGGVLVNGAVESANGIARMRLNGAGRSIEITAAGQTIKEPEIRFGGAVTFHAAENSWTLSEVEIDSGIVDISVPEWFVRIPGDGSGIRFAGRGDARCNVAVLSPFISEGGCDQLRGDLTVGLNATGDSGGTLLKLNGLLTDYYRLRDGEILFFEKRAELKSALAFNRGGDAVIESFSLYSSLADIVGGGEIKDVWKSRTADIRGDITLKFDTVEKLLRVRGIDEWKMTGHKKTPFVLKGPLGEGFLTGGRFTGGAYLASLNGLGMSAGGSDIALELERGRLACRWAPGVNGGRLRFHPMVDFSPRGFTLSLPPGERVLESVAITQGMMDNLLVHFNPLFHGSRIRSGTLSLKVNSMVSGPQPGHGDLVVDADGSLDNFEMTLSPSIRDLLRLIRVEDKVYRVKHLPLRFTVRGERVYMAPMTMVFSGQPVGFSGSVGFDSTVSYLIEIPLGEAISKKTGLKLPGGLTVKVPVTGTVDNPRLDTSVLEKTMGGFIRNALGDEALKNVTDFFDQLRKEIRK